MLTFALTHLNLNSSVWFGKISPFIIGLLLRGLYSPDWEYWDQIYLLSTGLKIVCRTRGTKVWPAIPLCQGNNVAVALFKTSSGQSVSMLHMETEDINTHTHTHTQFSTCKPLLGLKSMSLFQCEINHYEGYSSKTWKRTGFVKCWEQQ